VSFLEPGAPDRPDPRLLETFREVHGRDPQVVSRAPGRVNLIGEHTDYNAGPVLPIALPHTTWAAASRREDDRVTVRSLQADTVLDAAIEECGPGSDHGWAGYAAGVLWTLRQRGVDVPGTDLVVDSTVPVGAGLSSSAALECAVGAAVLALAGRSLTDDADLLVEAAIAAEGEVVGAPTGGMDQTVSVHAETGCALRVDFGTHRRDAVPLHLEEARLTVLVTDTRVSHALVDGGYASRRADCEEAARLLGVATLREADLGAVEGLADERLRRRARHVVSEIARVDAFVEALASGDLADVGAAMAASHASLRDDFEVSCPELDASVEAAVAAGAVGARMTGGGFGGSTVALVRTDDVEEVRAAIDARFAAEGFGAPSHLLAVPSPGASVVTTS
jgi:galactokinase